MIDTISSTVTTAASTAMKQSIGMDKDDFLKLFMTQLQHQDPLNPMDGTQFMTQLAQITQVEQAYNTNSNLQNILNALNGSSALAAASFMGKDVTATSSQVSLKDGEQPQIRYSVPKAATQVTLDIKNSSGMTVRTLTQGETAAGTASLVWDGKDNSGTQLPAGTYTVAVKGVDASGSSFSCTPQIAGTVNGVNMSGASTTITVGGVEIPISSILSVRGG